MPYRFVTFALMSAACLVACMPASAAPSTSRGQISVAQVIEMLDKAPSDRIAQQVLTAYLAGVGEAAGVAATLGGGFCPKTLDLTTADVRQAISAAAGKPDVAETSATPLIVRDMFARAKCKRSAM